MRMDQTLDLLRRGYLFTAIQRLRSGKGRDADPR